MPNQQLGKTVSIRIVVEVGAVGACLPLGAPVGRLALRRSVMGCTDVSFLGARFWLPGFQPRLIIANRHPPGYLSTCLYLPFYADAWPVLLVVVTMSCHVYAERMRHGSPTSGPRRPTTAGEAQAEREQPLERCVWEGGFRARPLVSPEVDRSWAKPDSATANKGAQGAKYCCYYHL